MANKLLESYKNRINLAESVHMKAHNGARMPQSKKIMLATMLKNTSNFLNEALDSSGATQRSALGDYKKFCLNVTNVALPNLILPELMLTQPMTSISGYVTYLNYTAGTDKGGVVVDQLFNGAYKMGEMNDSRMRYTSDNIYETHTLTSTDVNNRYITLKWAPVLGVRSVKISNNVYTVAANAEKDTSVSVDLETGKVTFAKEDTHFAANAEVDVLYVYDNVVIPQDYKPTSLPTLKAELASIDLHAHARRIAIYYSQIAAFQAKNDYGFDLGQQLAEQAQGELLYEIDTEGVAMLHAGAEQDDSLTFVKFDDNVQTAISRSQYYEAFTEIVARAKKIIYTRTQKFAPNYMVCGADVLTVLPYVKGWTPAPASEVNGPYFAGTLDSLKVFVSPSIPEDDFFFGVNGSDLRTSAAVYAPYMPIVPTQLLGLPDGGQAQGFSTMYDMKLLSTYNVSKDGGKRTTEDVANGKGQYSWLLVGGKLTSKTTYFNVKTSN